jgi:hypothetical protein
MMRERRPVPLGVTAAKAKRATEILTDGTIAARAMTTRCCVDVATDSATIIPDCTFGVARPLDT